MAEWMAMPWATDGVLMVLAWLGLSTAAVALSVGMVRIILWVCGKVAE